MEYIQKAIDYDEQFLIPGLPNDIAISCLAKVPLSYRAHIRTVCRSWRDIFDKDIFWDVRRELSTLESTLVLFQAPFPQGHRVWHVLEPSSKEWSGLPMMPDDEELVAGSTASAVIDNKLFVIGGLHRCPQGGYRESSTVSCFDMKSSKWRKAPSLIVARGYCVAGVINKKLYVCGGFISHSQNWWTETAEMYDPVEERWTKISGMKTSMVSWVQFPSIFVASVFDEKLYVRHSKLKDSRGSVYDPRTDEWSVMPKELRLMGGTFINFHGRVHVQRRQVHFKRSMDEECLVIYSYDSRDDKWKWFCDLLITQDEQSEWLGIAKDLLIFKENLSIVHVEVYAQEHLCRYVIKDLENRVITTSKPFYIGPRRQGASLSMSVDKLASVEYQIMVC